MDFIPFPAFEPDKSPFNRAAGSGLLNVLPSADGWKPQASFTEVSDALAAEGKNLIFARNAAEQFSIFATTATDIYKLNTSTSPYSWDEFSKSTGVYSLPASDRWSFAQFNDFLILCQLGDTPQILDLTSGTAFADLTTSPPTARYVKVCDKFVVFLYLDDGTNKGPHSVQWSDIGDHTYWGTAFDKWAGKRVLDSGFEIVGAVNNEFGGLDIFMRDGVVRMSLNPTRQGAFTFAQIRGARGASAPQSIVEIGDGRTLFLSDSGFYEWPTGRAVGAERVDQYFFDNVDQDYIFDVTGFLDPFEKVVWWKFRESDGTSSLLGYDYQLDRWCLSDQNLQAANKLATPGISWDGLDALYATIDDATVPFDSRLFKGGSPAFAGITTNRKLAFATGSNLAATLETAENELIPNRRAFVNGARLVGDAATFTCQFGIKETHGGTIAYGSSISPSSRSGMIGDRASGRIHQQKVSIAASATWSSMSGLYLNFADDGDL